MDPIILTASDDGAQIVAAPGQAIVIRLPENPTTGFAWQPPEGADIMGDDFVADLTGAAGAAGERIFTLAPCDHARSLVFGLSRPWESGTPAQQFTVHIKPKP
jgi:inhibitor of cysteine peptidase